MWGTECGQPAAVPRAGAAEVHVPTGAAHLGGGPLPGPPRPLPRTTPHAPCLTPPTVRGGFGREVLVPVGPPRLAVKAKRTRPRKEWRSGLLCPSVRAPPPPCLPRFGARPGRRKSGRPPRRHPPPAGPSPCPRGTCRARGPAPRLWVGGKHLWSSPSHAQSRQVTPVTPAKKKFPVINFKGYAFASFSTFAHFWLLFRASIEPLQ